MAKEKKGKTEDTKKDATEDKNKNTFTAEQVDTLRAAFKDSVKKNRDLRVINQKLKNALGTKAKKRSRRRTPAPPIPSGLQRLGSTNKMLRYGSKKG